MDKKGIFLENRHISLMLSAVILMGFFVFISGYFFGKKKTVEKFYSKVDQESLADHVYYSVCSNYGNYDRDQEQESTEDPSGLKDNLNVQDVSVQDISEQNTNVQDVSMQDMNTQDVNVISKNTRRESIKSGQLKHGYAVLSKEDLEKNKKYASAQNLQKDGDCEQVSEECKDQSGEQTFGQNSEQVCEQASDQYYAELVGFGSKNAANAFCSRLKKRGITVNLKKRRSRTSRGRNVDWYQAVTEKFDNKSDLVAFVDIIKDRENLKGVKIIES
jgi:hypothetical protein